MANIPCTRRHITLTSIINGSLYKGGVTFNGEELPNVQMTSTNEKNKRIYTCSNCGKEFDGAQTFDLVKGHFGSFPDSWWDLPEIC